MELILSDNETYILRDLLREQLHDLQFEVARTEAKDFRHLLLARQELIERLIDLLDQELSSKRRIG